MNNGNFVLGGIVVGFVACVCMAFWHGPAAGFAFTGFVLMYVWMAEVNVLHWAVGAMYVVAIGQLSMGLLLVLAILAYIALIVTATAKEPITHVRGSRAPGAAEAAHKARETNRTRYYNWEIFNGRMNIRRNT